MHKVCWFYTYTTHRGHKWSFEYYFFQKNVSIYTLSVGNRCVDLRVQNQRDAVDSQYTETRERALLQLVFDMTMKNVSSFILDNELIEIIIKAHGEKSLTLFYNTMAACGLNTIDSWKCLLSYAQSMVTCADCRGPVLWHKPDFDHCAQVDRFENIFSFYRSGGTCWKFAFELCMSKRKYFCCFFIVYREWKTELIDYVLTFGENHTKRIERILSTTSKVLEK